MVGPTVQSNSAVQVACTTILNLNLHQFVTMDKQSHHFSRSLPYLITRPPGHVLQGATDNNNLVKTQFIDKTNSINVCLVKKWYHIVYSNRLLRHFC